MRHLGTVIVSHNLNKPFLVELVVVLCLVAAMMIVKTAVDQSNEVVAIECRLYSADCKQVRIFLCTSANSFFQLS